MDKYVIDIFSTAQKVGTVQKIDMDKASKWLPKRIEISGTTAEGEAFCMTLDVGVPLTDKETGIKLNADRTPEDT